MVAIAVLAAGRGTRMKSDLPKVLHSLGGKSMVDRVLDACLELPVSRRLMIVGYGEDRVREGLSHHRDLEFVRQSEQLGTGHAVQQLLPFLEGYEGDLLVLNGDVPLLRPQTLTQLLHAHQTHRNAATLLTAQLENPKGYGRVFCDESDRVEKIVEDRDCTLEQRQNRRINAGVYCFNWPQLARILPDLSADNDQKEYYLTDVFAHLSAVMAVDIEDVEEISGINNRLQLANAYRVFQRRIKEQWLLEGVTLIDPDSITIDETVQLEPDTIIEPQTHLRGKTQIASGCRIGPGSFIENSQIAAGATVMYSVVRDSIVKANSDIGPFAHLRGHAEIGERCCIGNFVEVKNSQIGDRVNAKHLSYLGDATVGQEANIACGTITANFDGVKKHRTVIGDRAKTGSNCVLIAPITLGDDVTVAAGSTLNTDVPDGALAIARSRQTNKEDWHKRKR